MPNTHVHAYIHVNYIYMLYINIVHAMVYIVDLLIHDKYLKGRIIVFPHRLMFKLWKQKILEKYLCIELVELTSPIYIY